MNSYPPNPKNDIRSALAEVEALMAQAFAAVGGTPAPDSALDQCGLRDGATIITDSLRHGEAGVAFDHLLYMIREPALPISRATFFLIERAGRALHKDPGSWLAITPGADD